MKPTNPPGPCQMCLRRDALATGGECGPCLGYVQSLWLAGHRAYARYLWALTFQYLRHRHNGGRSKRLERDS